MACVSEELKNGEGGYIAYIRTEENEKEVDVSFLLFLKICRWFCLNAKWSLFGNIVL